MARAGSWAFHPQLDRSSLQGGLTRQDMPKVTAQKWPTPIKRGDGVEPFREAAAVRARYLTLAEAKRLVDNSAPDFRQLVQAALVTEARITLRLGPSFDQLGLDSRRLFFAGVPAHCERILVLARSTRASQYSRGRRMTQSTPFPSTPSRQQ
jgi:hypothetical protein